MNKQLFSIWIMPSGRILDKFRKLIAELSREYNTPIFEPHVTLLGDINTTKNELLSKADQLAQKIKPFTIKLEKLGYESRYFRCIYIKAEKSHELAMANDIAGKLFHRQNDEEFMPHLSIMYGNYDKLKKQLIIPQIKDYTQEFEVKSLVITDSSSLTEPKDWTIIKEIPLQGGKI